MDTEKAGFWSGGTAFVYLLGLTGEAPSANIGDLQVTDNIEAPESITLMEAWYEHSFADNRFSLLVGLYDYNSEFNVTSLSDTLINSSFGISPDIAQVGPTIFPVSSLTLRAKLQLTDAAYLIGSVSDGVSGSPRHQSGTHIVLGDDDGVFYGIESGLLGPEGTGYYKVALGGWAHTATFEDASGEAQDRNGGVYVIGEKRLYSESESEGLGGFLKIGFSRESVNTLAKSFVAGVAYTGAFPGRESDVLALGVAHAGVSDDFRAATEGALRAETAIELNYRASVQEWLAVTPDLQWIIDPGATAGVDDALALGVRVEIAL